MWPICTWMYFSEVTLVPVYMYGCVLVICISESQCGLIPWVHSMIRWSCIYTAPCLVWFAAAGLSCYVCTKASDNSQCQHVQDCADISSPTTNFDACQVSIVYKGKCHHVSALTPIKRLLQLVFVYTAACTVMPT